MARIGYARVSTEEQNLDLQRIALEATGCDTIITDQGISGARVERPGLNRVLALARRGDTVVVWRLDRLGRSLSHLVCLMAEFRVNGIHFASLNEAIDTGTSAGMFMFHMIAALAEFERALISERTRAGMAAARVRGVKLGRPRKSARSESTAHARDGEAGSIGFASHADHPPVKPERSAVPGQSGGAHASGGACEDGPGSAPPQR